MTSIPTPPTGTVTLVFTDVQGSTRLWERAPEAMWTALQRHDRVLREQLVAHGGYEVKTEGDAFMVAFALPVDAVCWCLAVQLTLAAAEWPADLVTEREAAPVDGPDGSPLLRGLRVRMGVHLGSAECRPDPTTGRMDYHGRMVNRAARIASSAHGGQILVSEEVWSAAAGQVSEVAVRDLGLQPLRDFG